ncbi:lysM and putative peptidoglycan-binding domain-containing protein 2-like [Tachypleus tridentatus]|uniref:lysM and putative peptidoglycan-binding domain-containing protein 2-like n=1 Tax=Tachypleus tridentatus TaxID=6853 RepID=UPI003FD27ACD
MAKMATCGKGGETETASLGSFAKRQIKYGSTSNHVVRREKYVKHVVKPTDTLQGLALHYGVTMEHIKRINKLWTTDSLFLRTTLDIPVPTESSPSSSDIETPGASPSEERFNPVTQAEESMSEGALGSPVKDCFQSLENVSDQTDSLLEESTADFLIRIDSSIAKSKDKARTLEKSILYPYDEVSHLRLRHQQYPYNNIQEHISSSDPSVPPQPLVMTQGRKVRSSLRRLEKVQDEIFEL